MFRFLRNVVVECVPYRAGDIVPAGEIPAGSVDCLLSFGHVEKYTPPEPTAPVAVPAVEVTETPKPAAKKAAKAASVPSE